MLFSIPDTFAQEMLQMLGLERGTDWLERLPSILKGCADRWQLTIFPPFAHLTYNYVAPAERADGLPVVIKVCPPDAEFAQQAEALDFFQGEGMVRLLEADAEQQVILLERLLPGTSLSQLVPEQDEQATSALAGVMRQIWRPVPIQHSFPTVEKWAGGLARLRQRYHGGCGPFPNHLVEEAETLFAELCRSSLPPMLLHGDLHHDNVLSCENAWRAIDPKGLVGDPGYETANLLHNPLPEILLVANPQSLIARRIDQLAEELEMDRVRIRAWGLTQAILAAWWCIEDGSTEIPDDILACAEILSNIK